MLILSLETSNPKPNLIYVPSGKFKLTKLGLKEEYQRVGMKYLEMCCASYIEAGHLWEAYNATKPGRAEKKEYPNTEMLGWTAGVYQWIYYYLFKDKKFTY